VVGRHGGSDEGEGEGEEEGRHGEGWVLGVAVLGGGGGVINECDAL